MFEGNQLTAAERKHFGAIKPVFKFQYHSPSLSRFPAGVLTFLSHLVSCLGSYSIGTGINNACPCAFC